MQTLQDMDRKLVVVNSKYISGIRINWDDIQLNEIIWEHHLSGFSNKTSPLHGLTVNVMSWKIAVG